MSTTSGDGPGIEHEGHPSTAPQQDSGEHAGGEHAGSERADSEQASTHQTRAAAPTGTDLMRRLWAGMPFGGQPWPFDDLADDVKDLATGGIRVEELLDNGLLVVRAELPGIDPDEDVQVVVDDGVLMIRAERREEKRSQREGGVRSEFRYGTFVRRIPLPRGASADVVSATYRDGILEVRLPAPAPGASSRRITVERA